jgi:NAD(P)-dependent dehydrogenase (short-subunit alcohol dehydrogenase family)
MSDDRSVIVTGGSRGLGLAITQRLVDEGYRVIVVARRETDALREERERAPDRIAFRAFDFGKRIIWRATRTIAPRDAVCRERIATHHRSRFLRSAA